MGHPHSDALHVVERIKRVDRDHLIDDITIEDPKAYTQSWTAHQVFVLQPKWTIADSFCEDEQSFEAIDESGASATAEEINDSDFQWKFNEAIS